MIDVVILLELPVGQSTKDVPLTIGKMYKLNYRNGGYVNITTDDPMLDVTLHQGRVKFLKDDEMPKVDAKVMARAMQLARDALFNHPQWATGEDVPALMSEFDRIKEALWYGDFVSITPMPKNDRQSRPKPVVEPTLTVADLRKAAKAKGATLVGTIGEYSVDAPDGMKWDGDTSYFVVHWNVNDGKDKQAALKDAIERINGASLVRNDEED